MNATSSTPVVSELIQTLLSKCRKSKDALKISCLPSLSMQDIQDIRDLPVPQSDQDFLPLRIRIGHVATESKIWLYIKRDTKTPVMLLETAIAGEEEPWLKEFALFKDPQGNIVTPGVQLDEPFYSARGGGVSHHPLDALAMYYLLRAYEGRKVDLRPGEFPINLERKDAKIGQYLSTGINAYCKTISAQVMDERDVDDGPESA